MVCTIHFNLPSKMWGFVFAKEPFWTFVYFLEASWTLYIMGAHKLVKAWSFWVYKQYVWTKNREAFLLGVKALLCLIFLATGGFINHLWGLLAIWLPYEWRTPSSSIIIFYCFQFSCWLYPFNWVLLLSYPFCFCFLIQIITILL